MFVARLVSIRLVIIHLGPTSAKLGDKLHRSPGCVRISAALHVLGASPSWRPKCAQPWLLMLMDDRGRTLIHLAGRKCKRSPATTWLSSSSGPPIIGPPTAGRGLARERPWQLALRPVRQYKQFMATEGCPFKYQSVWPARPLAFIPSGRGSVCSPPPRFMFR